MSVDVRKTAEEWNRDPDAYHRRGHWIVWDPDGWPRGDAARFQKEWYEDLLTEAEFMAHVGPRGPKMSERAAFAYLDPAELRRRHPKPALAVVRSATSEAAARAVEPVRGRIAETVYLAIQASSAGLTAQEVEEATGFEGNTVRPRLTELWEAQRIEKTTRTRRTRSGKQAQIWVARVPMPTPGGA